MWKHEFKTRPHSRAKIMVEVSASKCHPFFTGSVKFVDAAGRVDKFNKKFQGTYGKAKKARDHQVRRPRGQRTDWDPRDDGVRRERI